MDGLCKYFPKIIARRSILSDTSINFDSFISQWNTTNSVSFKDLVLGISPFTPDSITSDAGDVISFSRGDVEIIREFFAALMTRMICAMVSYRALCNGIADIVHNSSNSSSHHLRDSVDSVAETRVTLSASSSIAVRADYYRRKSLNDKWLCRGAQPELYRCDPSSVNHRRLLPHLFSSLSLSHSRSHRTSISV